MASTKHSNFNVFLSKTTKIILCIILAFLLFCLFSVAVYYFSTSDIHTFVLTPKLCIDLIGCYPNELDEDWASFFNERDVDYSIDSNGNLVLKMNERSLDSLRTTSQDNIANAIDLGVIFTDDYTQVTFDANRPIYKEELNSPWSVVDCGWIQLFDGVPAENIKVEVVAIDYSTNEIVYQATWPNYITYTYITDEVKITYFIEDGVSYYREVPVK